METGNRSAIRFWLFTTRAGRLIYLKNRTVNMKPEHQMIYSRYNYRSQEMAEPLEQKLAQTPEAIALALLFIVAAGEGRRLNSLNQEDRIPKDWVLSTYGDCLSTVKSRRPKTQSAAEAE